MVEDYEYDVTTDRKTAAALLHDLADGVAAGAVRLGDDELAVRVPDEFDLAVEFETAEGVRELEVELEWQADAEAAAEDGAEGAGSDAEAAAEDGAEKAGHEAEAGGRTGDEDDMESPGLAEPAVGRAARNASLGRFELFEDSAGEWRWRLVHDNGNVIAASGEGYTRKHNARKGLRSVMRNAPGADVTERTE